MLTTMTSEGGPTALTATQMDTAAVALHLGVSRDTVTRYQQPDRAQYGFPEPDGRIGGRPWWWSTTIEAWEAQRPGKGAGAGRPPRTQPAAE